MKYLQCIMIIASSILLLSCDDRDAFITKNNATPSLEFFYQGQRTNLIKDTVKISLKSDYSRTPLKLIYSDLDSKIPYVNINYVAGGGMINDGIEAKEGVFYLQQGAENELFIEPEYEGDNVISFNIKDPLDKEVTIEAHVHAFLNLVPVANISYSYRGVNSPNEILIDASRSYDQDQKYGGYINLYEYTVKDLRFTSQKKSIPFDLGANGNYNVSVRVQDNDGEWSSPSSLIINTDSIQK